MLIALGFLYGSDPINRMRELNATFAFAFKITINYIFVGVELQAEEVSVYLARSPGLHPHDYISSCELLP